MVKKQTTHRKIIDGVLCSRDQKSQIGSVTLTSSTRRDSSDWYECYVYHSSMYNGIRRVMTYMVINFFFARGTLMASYHPSETVAHTGIHISNSHFFLLFPWQTQQWFPQDHHCDLGVMKSPWLVSTAITICRSMRKANSARYNISIVQKREL